MCKSKIRMFRESFGILTLCAVLAASLIFSSNQALAAKDVTAKLKQDKGIRWITSNMTYYGEIMWAKDAVSKNKKHTVKMNATNKFSIAALLSANKYYKVNSSDTKDIKYKGYSYWAPALKMNHAKKLYKKLYGQNVNMSKVKNKPGILMKKGKKCYVVFGEFGADIPAYSIKQIVKKKKGIYCITANMIIKSDEGYPPRSVGKMWITVKKDKKAQYGYKVKKVSFSIK